MGTYRRNTGKLPDLAPFEERLEEGLRGVNIIGELNIDRELYDTLRDVFAMRTRMDQFQWYARRYPACLAVHLVAEGIYGYKGSNYWEETPLDQCGTRSDQGRIKEYCRHVCTSQARTFKTVSNPLVFG